jgi:hypothetical protein
VSEDATVKVKHLDARSITIRTYLVNEADAQAEGDRVLALLKVERERYGVAVALSDGWTAEPGLGVTLRQALQRHEPARRLQEQASQHGATNKTTPVDADEFGFWDSVGQAWNKLTWANLNATLKATTAQFLANTAGYFLTTEQFWAGGAEVTIAPPTSISTLTLTFSNGSQTITSSSAHGMAVGDPFHPTTTGALPTNFTANQELWVVSAPTSTTLTASAARGGSAITAGSAGSGTHTLNKRLLLDFATFINAKVTLAASIVVATPVNMTPGKSGRIRWIQSGAGSFLRTFPTGGTYQTAGGASTIAAVTTGSTTAKDIDYYETLSSTEMLIGATPLKSVAA